jgi:LmbE family N-acetylglucosaminyl deacetylase
MLKISFESSHPKKILCLGAHCDDIEIGCGGTLLKLIRTMKDVHVYWVVFSSDERREKEALKSANDFLKSLRKKKIVIKRFRNSFFPYCGAEIKEYFEQLTKEFSPDIIFTHFKNDLHQDHRLISELTWNTYRNHLILEYEIPKYDGDLGSPNFFIQFDGTISRNKIEKIMKYFKSQYDKSWFTRDTLSSLLRLRGVESNAPDKYADCFYCRIIIL